MAAVALAVSAVCSHGYTYVQVGVDSNFLIDSNRVFFAQADGSLAVLALDSGDILARRKSLDFSGTLVPTAYGILVLNDRNVALIDATNFDTVWQARGAQNPVVTARSFISQNHEGQVECRNIADGALSWSFAQPGALQIAADGTNVLILRPATYEAGLSPSIVVLDERNGTELLRRSPTNQLHWGGAYLDGTNIFLVAGNYNVERSDYEPDHLSVWTANGSEPRTIPIPEVWRALVKDGKPFELDGKTFWMGRVYSGSNGLPVGKMGRSQRILEQTNAHSETFETDYDLADGVTFVAHAKHFDETNGLGGAFVMQIELRSPGHAWSGVLPYLLDRGRIVALAKAGNQLLVGTDFGQVECIDASTGESAWLYTFPTLRRTSSFSSRGMPPMQTEAAAAFRSDNANPPSSGLHVINGKARAPRIVPDPDPVDPYLGLRLRLALAWSAAGAGVVALLLVHLIGRLRSWSPGSAGGVAVWITFLLFCGFLAYGRVSPESSLALKSAIFTGFLFGSWDILQSWRRRLWIEGAILAITFAGIGLFIYLTTA